MGCEVNQGLYGQAELSLVPELALNLSRGCGNPTGFANLQPGEVVMDFGCGGGIDAILAAHKVGEQGKVGGIDFAPQMIERAKQAVAEAGLQDKDIELRVADMEETQLPDSFADVVISNCVINLCPDKEAVYNEAFRILRLGGRLAISDIVLTVEIDSEVQAGFQPIFVGCLGGAIPEDDNWQAMRKAGFAEIRIVAHHILTHEELKIMACCPGEEFMLPPSKKDLLFLEGKVASVKFTAVKPSMG